MHIVFHAGVHATDEDRLIKCFLKNTEAFAALGTAVPGPSRYRRLIRDAVQALADGDPAPDARTVLLEAIIDGDTPERMILSNDSFFGVPKLAVGKGVFYPGAEVKLTRLCTLFAQDRIELTLALRNPATFVPAVFALAPDADLGTFLGGADPRQLRWSELLGRIKTALPDMDVTVWCNEDTPLLWAHLIREMAGLEPNTKIIGGFDLLSEIMSKPSMQRFRAYLKTHPSLNEIQKRRVITAFLDKYALDDAIEEEVDLPGWTDHLIREMTELYEEDIFTIQRMPGITLITP
ncbi:MAG: hypothetical protein B7X55_07780 [Rhodobacterales bacterium 34-62-10]|nr:MAG: hypothetical protein B7X55_07780 [Rhodobacterales bacterium 34-62-10]